MTYCRPTHHRYCRCHTVFRDSYPERTVSTAGRLSFRFHKEINAHSPLPHASDVMRPPKIGLPTTAPFKSINSEQQNEASLTFKNQLVQIGFKGSNPGDFLWSGTLVQKVHASTVKSLLLPLSMIMKEQCLCGKIICADCEGCSRCGSCSCWKPEKTRFTRESESY